MLTVKRAEHNLEAIARDLEPRHWRHGRRWYHDAHLYCSDLAREFNLPLASVVGGLAVLSPNCRWEINKQAIRTLLSTGTCKEQVYPANVVKAKRIVFNGENLLEVMNHPRYGSKVKSFYRNILDPVLSNDVTVDTHASRAAFDKLDLTRKELRWVFESGRGYRVLADAYVRVSDKLKVRPLHLQAAIWLLVKENLEEN